MLIALQRAARQAEIEASTTTRADIARREGATRARVTQLMKLLDLPAAAREAILAGNDDAPRWSIKAAIRAATATGFTRSASTTGGP